MRGLALLLACWLAGELIVRASGVPLPGQVAGMALLLISLRAGWIKTEWVQDAADMLLSRMMLFFAPIIVGVIAYWPIIAGNWLPVAGALLPGTLLALAAGGWAASAAARRRNKSKSKKKRGTEHVGA